jgi:hypothetical protein
MMFVVMLAGFAIMTGLVVDGIGRLQAEQRLDAIAQESARAGGQAIDPGAAVSGQRIYVTQAAAEAAAQDYLNQVGVSGTAFVTDNGEDVTVSVHAGYQPLFLGAFGFGPWTLTGTGSATLVAGVIAP